MWIALEGVDGSGKSTLVEAIGHQVRGHLKFGHLGPPKSPDTAIDECLTGGIDESEHDRVYKPGNWHLVSDRLQMGYPCYGPVFRPDVDRDGYGELGRAGWRYVELYLASRGAVTFLIQASPETAIARVEARNSENHFSVEKIVETLPELIARYDWLAADTMTLGARIFEHSLDEVDDWADRMIRIASAQEDEVREIAEFIDYVGPSRPTTLIICEPTRELRLEVLDAVSDDAWRTIGFCSSAHSVDKLERLASALGDPAIMSLGNIPAAADSFVWNANGMVAHDVAEVAASL